MCLVEAPSRLTAVMICHEKKINPGGEVISVPCASRFEQLIGAEWRDRLLTKDECVAISMILDPPN